jgi:quercetin dioxygenase-like cupin family protein
MEKRSWDRIEEEKITETISRKMFWGRNIMVTRWVLAANASLPVHDHEAEQVTMVEKGSVTLHFPESGEDFELGPGDMLVIPASVPHGVTIGPEECTVKDIFSPIRQDFIEKTSTYLPGMDAGGEEAGRTDGERDKETYRRLNAYLAGAGIKIPMERLREVPLDIVGRYVYERGCITMGQLREIMGWDKAQAKEHLRTWKHGDDHSQASYDRMLERMVLLPPELTKSQEPSK